MLTLEIIHNDYEPTLKNEDWYHHHVNYDRPEERAIKKEKRRRELEVEILKLMKIEKGLDNDYDYVKDPECVRDFTHQLFETKQAVLKKGWAFDFFIMAVKRPEKKIYVNKNVGHKPD